MINFFTTKLILCIIFIGCMVGVCYFMCHKKIELFPQDIYLLQKI